MLGKTVYLGLGSNVGNREEMLQAALDRLHSRELRIERISSVYETEPQGRRNQRWFLNLVAEARTDLFPRQLLGRIAKIEQELGRRRMLANGPRTIDIDILFFGGFVVETAELTIPHPRIAERRFVLAPMVELAPELRDPVTRRTMRELLATTVGQDVRKVDAELKTPA
ncbi:MAG TPA: 2-amino-4-hydroxy-6-hydroxymethyldihydropteridine diphosphokinase [Bryobacteraceae bacterium]|nr:2-amino-4-hydroxy-6-hydroxymethyldihydropteridine diphosphokinase [Bryobacteraceae bacterium]